MKKTAYILKLLLFCFLIGNSGCQPPPNQQPTQTKDSQLEKQKPCICKSFAPDKIEIMPLTELTITNSGRTAKIKTYVTLLDSFNCQNKWPGTFRFELYERVHRSTEPKGKRVQIWPDLDLTNPETNNQYWRDFLRAYEFNLEFEATTAQDYILQVTCLTPDKKRLLAELPLMPQKK